MRILLLCSAFNGLSQRAWLELRAAGHEVVVLLAGDEHTVPARVAAADPDLVICPFLRERVPAEVWTTRPTIVIHPGPMGDRGPSALDWAIMGGAPVWGVTAVAAVEEFDAGPIWGSRNFPVEDGSRKSDLYNGQVTDAAVALILDVVAKAADPWFVPEPLDYARPEVWGRPRPAARQADRAFSWSDPTEHVLRRIRAADGSPGVHTTLCGVPVAVFDAHPATVRPDDARWAGHDRGASPRRGPRADRGRRGVGGPCPFPGRGAARGPQAAGDDGARRAPLRCRRVVGRRPDTARSAIGGMVTSVY